MKKSEPTLETDSYTSYKDATLMLDLQQRTIANAAGSSLELKSKSFHLLRVLIEYSPSPLSVEQLKQLVWGTKHIGEDTVRQRIKLLRSELKKCYDDEIIKNERSKGYYVHKSDIDFASECSLQRENTERSVKQADNTTHRARWKITAIISFIALISFSVFLTHKSLLDAKVKLSVSKISPQQLNQHDAAFVDGFSLQLSELLIRLPDIDVFSSKSNTVDAKILIGLSNREEQPAFVIQLLDMESQQYLWSKTYPIKAGENYNLSLASISAHVAMMLKTHYDDEIHQSIISGQTQNPAALAAFIFASGYYQNGNISLATKYLNEVLQHDPNFQQAIDLKRQIDFPKINC